MHRRYLLFLVASILGVVFAVIPLFQYHGATGLPFQVERKPTGDLVIVALPGIPLPDGLEKGDVIDWSALTPDTRMAVNTSVSYQRMAAGNRFTLAIRRDQNELAVQVESVPLINASGSLTSLIYTIIQNVLLLVLFLLTLWRGRNWTAWGLSAYALCWILGSTDGMFDVSYVTDLILVVTSDLLIYPLALIGLFLSADSLAGPFLDKRFRLSLKIAVGSLIGLLIAFSLARTFGSIFLGWQIAQWYGVMMVCAISLVILALVTLLSGYRLAPSDARLRLRWIIAATLLLVMMMVMQYLTPLALSLAGGMMINAIMAICFTCYLYGVLRYRLVDLSIVIDRTLVYGGMTALVVGIIAAVNSLVLRIALPPGAGLLLQVIVPLSLGIVLSKLRTLMDVLVEQVFFRGKYLTEQALRAFARRAGHIDRAQDLLEATVREVSRHLGVPAVAIYSAEAHGFRCRQQMGDGNYPAEIDSNDDALLAIRAEGKTTDLARLSSALGTESCVFPMLVLGNLRGLLVIKNRTGEHFASDEKALLEEVAQQIGATLRILRARDNEALVTAMAMGSVQPDAAFAEARRLSFAWVGNS